MRRSRFLSWSPAVIAGLAMTLSATLFAQQNAVQQPAPQQPAATTAPQPAAPKQPAAGAAQQPAATESAQPAARNVPPNARPELVQKFDQAVKLYNQGDYEQSVKLLDEVIKQNPSSYEALVLRERAGTGLLVKMLKDDKMRVAATKILRTAAEESGRLQRDPATIKKLIDQTTSNDFVERETAVRHLTAVGPFAVPYLLDEALSDEPYSLTSKRVAAIRIIRNMGNAGIPPLLVAFENGTDNQAVHIAAMLTDSPDARSVPALESAAQDRKAPADLRKAAQGALDAIYPPKAPSAAAPTVDAAAAYLDLAKRYYYSDVVLVEMLPVWQRVIWTWKPAGKTFAERLVFEQVPDFVYPRRLADALLLNGMQLPHKQPEFLELFVCNNYMQIEDALAAKDTARVETLAPLRRVNESLGALYLYRALTRALLDGTTPLAVDCIAALRAVNDPRPPAENSLIAALSYPDKTVRAMASETLMRLSPSGEMGATDQTIGAAAGALGSTMRPRVLVMTSSDALYKLLAADIRAWNMMPERRLEQVDVVASVRGMTPPASLLLLDAREPGANPLPIAQMLARDLGKDAPPVIVLAPADQVEKLRAKAGTSVAGVLPVPPETPALKAMATAAVASSKNIAADEILQNTELAKRMLATIASLPVPTRYPSAELAGAMMRLSTNYPQDIRLLALQAIAVLPSAEPRDAMLTIMANAKEPVEVRRAAATALQHTIALAPNIDPDQLALLRRLTADADAQVAGTAVCCIGIANIPQPRREAHVFEIGANALAAQEKAAPAPEKTGAPEVPAAPAKSTTSTTSAKPGATTTTVPKSPAPATPAAPAK